MRPSASEYALVATGGGAGVLVRYVLILAFRVAPAATIFWINTAGSFLLGLLLALATAVPTGRGRKLRLLLGTGFLGGFTTYSALAVGSIEAPSPALGIICGTGTVAIGILAALVGSAVGAWLTTTWTEES